MLSRKHTHILTCVIVAILLIPAFVTEAIAQGKKGRATASRSKGKTSKQAKSSRSKSSSRKVAKRSKRSRGRVVRRSKTENYKPVANPPVVPDHIEVLEYGSTSSAELSRWLNPPQSRSQADANVAANSTITPSRKVNIDSMRVIQIQQALTNKGFYSGETNGVYDQETIEAMRQFQASHKIAATGYPTAHALKRLGLGKW